MNYKNQRFIRGKSYVIKNKQFYLTHLRRTTCKRINANIMSQENPRGTVGDGGKINSATSTDKSMKN
jgi:hypothetical protein